MTGFGSSLTRMATRPGFGRAMAGIGRPTSSQSPPRFGPPSHEDRAGRRGGYRLAREVRGIAKLAFGAPLYLYAERARPKLGMIQLRCVDDGLSSLRRGDLGKYRFESDGDEREIWGTALSALASAKFRPSVERTEAARSALRNLASASGALATIREAPRHLHSFSGS
jgi:hypothetical protein